MRVYLDNCSFNRPFDDQKQIRIRLETAAKLHIQQLIDEEELDLVWSYILEYENTFNPYSMRRIAIARWKPKAVVNVEASLAVENKAKELSMQGLKSKDALHIACALESRAVYFITTDDKLLNKNTSIPHIKIMNPVDMIKELE